MQPSPLTKYLCYQLYHATLLRLKLSPESDIEVLHQYRVAIRRCRSLLRLYLPDYYALQEVLKEIVQQTNLLRELDVFIASVDPKEYGRVLRLLKEYRNEQFEVFLSEKSMRQTLKALNRLYDTLSELNPDLSTAALVETAQQHARLQIHTYETLPEKTPEEALHRLRIRFKVARYALEFLQQSGLHEEKEQIRRCKEIQDHLGAVQDAANQLSLLKSFCKTHKSTQCRRLLKERKEELKALKKLTGSTQ